MTHPIDIITDYPLEPSAEGEREDARVAFFPGQYVFADPEAVLAAEVRS